MPNMTSDNIRDVAVKCAEGFFNNKVPLSQGLAKVACDLDMNMEQIKRASEACNVITQLKLMKLSDDKTVEFPLCKVAEVMSNMCLPDEHPGSTEDAPDLPGPTVEVVEKTASAQEPSYTYSDHEATVVLIKQAGVNRRVLDELNSRSVTLTYELQKTAQEVKTDSDWLNKLSCVESEHFAQLSSLVSGSVAQRRDFGEHVLYKEAELKTVKKLSELYKEAQALVAETSRRRELEKRATTLQGGLKKEAFLGAAARGLGMGIGKTVSGVGSGIGSTIKGVAKFARKPGTFRGVAGAVAADAGLHNLSGGTLPHSDGTPRDVWSALQG